MKTIILGGTVLPIDGLKTVLRDADVYIDGNNIVAVGQAGTPFEEWEADKTIDASGMAVMPGLVNAHTHTGMTYVRGMADDVNLDGFFRNIGGPLSQLSEEDIYWNALLAITEMIKSGTTTFSDMFNDMDAVGRAVDQSGLRASLGTTIYSRGINSKDVPGILDKYLKIGVDFATKWDGAADGRITTMIDPHAPYTCSLDALKVIAQVTNENSQKICIHLAETKEQVTANLAEYGRTPVGMLADAGILEHHVLAAHSIHLSDDDLDILSGTNFHVAHCPQCNLKLALGIARVGPLLEHGINVAIGTDSTSSNNNLDMFEEFRLVNILHKWVQSDPSFLPGEQVLQMATSGGAAALGLKDLGTIEVGKHADIILLDLSGAHMHPQNDLISNVIYASSSSDVKTMIVDGKVVMEDRKILTFDEGEVIREADKRMAQIQSNIKQLSGSPN